MKKIIALLILIIAFANCERDDICSGETPTTPHLIIRFYDDNNPDELKDVTDLRVYGEGNEDTIIGSVTDTDSIVLPLKTTENITRFILHKDYDSEDMNAGNKDILEVTYTREQLFVSRACGYKTIFKDVNIINDTSTDPDNWIKLITPLTNPLTVENETAAQVHIFY